MKEKVTKLFSTVKAMWDKPLEGRFLNLKEILSFGMYSLGNSWIYNTIMLVITITYIPYFYGIDAIHGYTIYIGGSLINMFLVPLIGQAMEKKRTKWGRYKPYILFSLPLLALFTMMSMWAPQCPCGRRSMTPRWTASSMHIVPACPSSPFRRSPTICIRPCPTSSRPTRRRGRTS